MEHCVSRLLNYTSSFLRSIFFFSTFAARTHFLFFWLTFFRSVFLWDTSVFALQLFQTYILVEEVVVNEEGKAGIFSFWWGSN
jgi:hypothetical protein